jgi:addiction module HigA family antidote
MNRLPTHPGEVLLVEFLKPRGITQVAFARHIGVSTVRLNELIRGKRSCTAETAWLLAGALGTSPYYWSNLQMIAPIRSGFDRSNPNPPRRTRAR